MFKKTVTYTDYNGVERTEDFYFNLSKAELMEMELSKDGGMIAFIRKIVQEKRTSKLSELFKDLLLKSYGQKSEDGKRFIKNDELREEFTQTEAYSDIYMELATDADAAVNFVKGIMPSDLAKEIGDIKPEDIMNGNLPEQVK